MVNNYLERSKKCIQTVLTMIRIVTKRDRVRFKIDWLKKFPARLKFLQIEIEHVCVSSTVEGHLCANAKNE